MLLANYLEQIRTHVYDKTLNFLLQISAGSVERKGYFEEGHCEVKTSSYNVSKVNITLICTKLFLMIAFVEVRQVNLQ